MAESNHASSEVHDSSDDVDFVDTVSSPKLNPSSTPEPSSPNQIEDHVNNAAPDLQKDAVQENEEATPQVQADNTPDQDEAFEAADAANDEWNENGDEDDFGDFDTEFVEADDDAFGDFDDFEGAETVDAMDDFETDIPPPPPTDAEKYVTVLEEAPDPDTIANYVEGYLTDLWKDSSEERVASPLSMTDHDHHEKDILCTKCSADLWEKLSRDSIFYNPITGALGQFQWTRSETNRAYLRALGVSINYEEKSSLSSGSLSNCSSPVAGYRSSNKRPQSNYLESKSNNSSGVSLHEERKSSPNGHLRSASLSGMAVSAGKARPFEQEKKAVEPEAELDIDIAKAYCELTEETIRVFPDVKLTAMIGELTRLQRQATEYLGYLLDQREQLLMDAETYNDLISCIVGHAQRLREQSVNKDASPAMVSKKKKSGAFSGMMRRKQNSSIPGYSASMGGGVVGIQQPGQPTNKTPTNPITEGRRSM
ncbi:uncharacterized protein BYT42DRAFT_581391 [Radiomyces spectabilis]|uniref:uncharacterized protein n=1 Tax=Radiomyces spectabilis TaxID=64574 RepID=UPI00221ECB2E|nr:uncharacterized protein BYT42DRAFT_581391 [Radiomyces spectabilis]KAI8371753.1 hypothetical protein BYT42DRAFT_581391 [Radiomyces spectabilis]